MTTPDAAVQVADAFRNGLENLEARPSVNEAATRSVLIDPLLNLLGYPAENRSPDEGKGSNIPDYLCYVGAVSRESGYPSLVVEAKRLGEDFDRAPSGQHRAASPDRQIQRYLRSDKISGPYTIGVLTDGARWRVYQRGPFSRDIEHLRNFNLRDILDTPQALLRTAPEDLGEFLDLLASRSIAAKLHPERRRKSNLADTLFESIESSNAPQEILKAILDEPNALIQDRLDNAEALSGARQDLHDNYWESYAIAQGPRIETSNPDLQGSRIPVAAVKYRFEDGQEISRGDAAMSARTVAASGHTNSSVVFVYETAPDGSMNARMAVAAAGQVNMTAPFDPTLPSPSVRAAIDQQLRLLRYSTEQLTADKLLSPLGVANLRQQFYKEVAEWTARVQMAKDQTGREAVLRHLIRVMFAWILKEENRIPPELFERAFVHNSLRNLDDYHESALRFLFHQRLNVRHDERDDHPNGAIHLAMERAPFLNGSLFAQQRGDDDLRLTGADYWSIDEDAPGLFTILARYHWTMDEHRPGESEQTLDPELLSNLFERLIASTELGVDEESPTRQPKGTYYTPSDVVDEMVKDALSAAVKEQAGTLTDTDLLDLFGDSDSPLPEMDSTAKSTLTARIRELRIFDPAVGSGAFLFSMLHAIRRSLKKLDGIDEPAEDIIKRQLRGQDISPLAVQIARLRLFISITASRMGAGGQGSGEVEALPNLEAVIVCADTLETVADPEWRSGQLDMSDPEVGKAVQAIGENRAKWFDIHEDKQKTEVLRADKELRAALEILLHGKGELASPELKAFTKAELVMSEPAKTDARLLFYENPWRGFDIVIGNPPYEALSKSVSADERRRLANEKGYKTTKVGDLYTLFCETALSLAKPEGGVVTLVLPLSIAFGQAQSSVRDVFGARCSSVWVRHYDNIPDTIFNGSPTLKAWKNSQRATILIASMGSEQIEIRSTGLQRWSTSERELVLRCRLYSRLPTLASSNDSRLSKQWLRIPTNELAQLIVAVSKQQKSIESLRCQENTGIAVAFPETARYFLGAIPASSVQPRRENSFLVENREILYLVVAALNSHVGYGWWRMVGDGFDVKAVADLGLLKIPDKWIENPAAAIDMGRRLVEAIPECITEKKNSGTVWKNVNFHLRPDLIRELDHLHIKALGLEVEPLLTHLKIMRSSSSWNFSRSI